MQQTTTPKFWIATILAIVVAAPVLAQVEPDPLAGLDAFIEQGMELWDIPGAAVAVVKDQKVVFARGFGVRDLEKDGSVDADTVFAIGSNTKAFTATAIGQLVAAGKISWDDPVLLYMPEFQMYDPVVTREITIRDLLSHRAGLGTFQGDLMSFGSIYDRAQIIERIRYIEPAYDFRAGFGYSNLMFEVAGEIIPLVTDLSWDEYIDQQFFKPLGMDRSSTSQTAYETMANVATPHGLDDGKVVPIPHDKVDNIAPAGAINSTANDIAKWLLLQTANGSFDGVQIVDPAVISETRTPQNLLRVGAQAKEINPWTNFSTYGLGWGLSDYRGHLMVSHGGGLNGMISFVGMLPDENLGVVVLTNFDTHGLTRSVVYQVFDAYLGAGSVDWIQRYQEAIRQFTDGRKNATTARAEARIPNTSPSLSLESYAGRYTSEVYGDADITLEGGVLILDPKAHPEITGSLEHWQLDTFLCTWTDRVWDQSLVYFDLNDAGKVSDFRVTVRPDWLDTLEYVFVKQPE
jgi:CubicO group peptidase (beta-lactamase class C family)